MTRLEKADSRNNDESLGSLEQRWQAWQQRGRAHAIRSHRRLTIGLAVLAAAVILVGLARIG